MNMASVNASGSFMVEGLQIDEPNIRRIAKDEAQKALRLKTKELKKELDEETPIRILRRKVQEWLKS